MTITKIFVAGAGLMGGGIAQVCAQAGYEVVMRDLTEDILSRSMKAIRWSAGKLVEKGRVSGTLDQMMARIRPVTELEAAAEADFVFEAVIEDLEAKKSLFAELDGICPAHTLRHIGCPLIHQATGQRFLHRLGAASYTDDGPALAAQRPSQRGPHQAQANDGHPGLL